MKTKTRFNGPGLPLWALVAALLLVLVLLALLGLQWME
jgi:hypothetical protein